MIKRVIFDIDDTLFPWKKEYFEEIKKVLEDMEIEYPETFINNITKRWENCAPDKISQEIIETLEYLKSKYELVALTDWYEEQQKARLKKANILKYF